MTAVPSKQDLSAPKEDEVDHSEFQRLARSVLNRWTRTAAKDVLIRLARTADLSALCTLNSKSIREQNRNGLFMPMSESFLAKMVRDGIILVLERDGELLGYSIAVPTNHSLPPFIPEKDPARVGLLFGTAIDPALRGQHWHSRLILIRQKMFAEAGFTLAQSTASPFNTTSLRNMINAGFHVVGLKTLLDGHPRFLLRHEFQRPKEPSGPLHGVALPEIGDLSEHQSLLANGFIATGFRKGKPCVMLYSQGQGQISARPDS